MEQSFKTKMQQHINWLTHVEQAITDYTFARGNRVMQKSIAKLALSIGVATSGAVRFCKKLCYRDYIQMNLNLVSYGLSADEVVLPAVGFDNYPASVLEKYFRSGMNRLIRDMR